MAACMIANPDVEPQNVLLDCSVLLSNLTLDQLQQCFSHSFQSKPPNEQLVRFFRAVRSQEFLARQVHAMEHKDKWIDSEYKRYEAPRRVTSKSAQDEFYHRLMQDTDRRAARKSTAMAEKIARETAMLKSSKLWGLSHKLCRRP
jgi:hypothetical protein